METCDQAKLEKLTENGMLILQPQYGYRFSLDAVLLARFASVKPGFKIIDLGTGSGVIPLLLTTRARDIHILGIEIQESLATLAKKSVALNQQEKAIQIWHQDLNEIPSAYNGKWDLVISNPPFFKLDTGKVCQGESQAIARHEIKCSLADIVAKGSRLLKSKGSLAIIHRPERLVELFKLLSDYKLQPTRLKFVHPKQGQEATMFLLEAVKGTVQTLKILSPLFVYDDFGQYSLEMQNIFNGKNM
ncbi:tRNA1(Val) (adenine(37)-N6)-methyltransferase [Bacillota bacterium LX-D]|nr:tRNA1(Val) (adenine(37)-N6)-methyltransferase [Bacillota bacterium LX-D]